MNLKEKINNDLKEAMKSRDENRLNAIKSIKAAILIAETEKGSNKNIDESQELKILQKLLKQRKDSAEIYIAQNRNDLADVEIAEAKHIEKYLPKMIDLETLEKEISKIIKDENISNIKDFGAIMKIASKKFAGKSDNAIISKIIKNQLT